MSLRLNDWFCGAGGATQGAHVVPGISPVLAANHNEQAIATHSANFPDVEHFRGDIRDLDVAGHPYAEIFWASPECTNWSVAKGKKVDFASNQPGLFDEVDTEDDVMRSRALMQDVIRYLEGMDLRQQPVLAGVVENVTDIRKWEHWQAWRSRIERIGYRTRLIALNSMHAQHANRPGRRPSWLSRLRRTDQAVTDAVIALGQPTDRPHDDAIQIAGDVERGPITVKPGRGLAAQHEDEWEAWIAPVLELCRPRGRMCAAGCGAPGIYRDPARPDRVWCSADKPAGLTVVDGGGAA